MTRLRIVSLLAPAILATLPASALDQDRKAADPAMRVFLDNDHVRVQEHRLAPGESVGMHSHPCYFIYVTQDAKVRFTLADGSTREAVAKADSVFWHEAGSHAVENIGDTEVRNIVTELKTCDR
ncbi:MAG: hypothetical protein RIC56_01985 [Pseudomonadales bacterium]